jgi:3-hydroxyisobutyrate dehydrogenase-like beta-hydroxyacid dehydrogenase
MSEQVSVIGLGNMGAALARAFLAAGHTVTVWNRTPAKGEPLAAAGATVASTAAEAITASPATVACVTRYEHVYESLSSDEAGRALSGTTLVNLTWGSPSDAEAMQEWAHGHGAAYLDGGIPVYPAGIGQSDTSLVYAGAREVWDRHATLLADLGGASRHVGDFIGAANVVSLAIPGAFYHMALGAFYEAAAYADRLGVDVTELTPMIAPQLTMLRDAVYEGIDAVDQNRYETDQATLFIHLDAMRTAREAMADAELRGTQLRALVDVMERGVAAGNAELGVWSLLKLLSDGG